MVNFQPSSHSRVRTEAEIENALAAFAASTGLLVCIKHFLRRDQPTLLEPVSGRHNLHRSAFCMEVKKTRTDLCKACDLRWVPEKCEANRRVFTHVCHAGASEVIVPLFAAGTLAAVAYIGQFRTRPDQPAELPLLTPDQHARLESLATLLEAYLGELLRPPRHVPEGSKSHRAEAIRSFLERHLRDNPSLSDLARHLGLSTTRAAHVVREATGSSFVELRDELRLTRAVELLADTYHKIAHIASECGFSSPQHFHRFFRRHQGATPREFRHRQRMDI